MKRIGFILGYLVVVCGLASLTACTERVEPSVVTDSSTTDENEPKAPSSLPTKLVEESSNVISDGDHAGEVRKFLAERSRFCWCPPGTYLFGAGVVTDGTDSYPGGEQREVKITLSKGFWLGQTEVPQQLWVDVMGTKPWMLHSDNRESHNSQIVNELTTTDDFFNVGANYPACNGVTWLLAKKFCEELTRRESKEGRLPNGWSYSLPTEAEWEYASRAGSDDLFCFGSDWTQLHDFAWFNDSMPNRRYPQLVAQKRPNAWNLYDMHGNLAEYCLDDWSPVHPGGIDPHLINGNIKRVSRGGGWWSDATVCWNCTRKSVDPANGIGFYGFRIALVRRIAPSDD